MNSPGVPEDLLLAFDTVVARLTEWNLEAEPHTVRAAAFILVGDLEAAGVPMRRRREPSPHQPEVQGSTVVV